VKPPVRYLIPPDIAEKDLPPEVRAGLRLCVRIAARMVQAQARAEAKKQGDDVPATI
jgi:hypothetical protein